MTLKNRADWVKRKKPKEVATLKACKRYKRYFGMLCFPLCGNSFFKKIQKKAACPRAWVGVGGKVALEKVACSFAVPWAVPVAGF